MSTHFCYELIHIWKLTNERLQKQKQKHTRKIIANVHSARAHLKKEKPPNGEVLADVKIAQRTGLCLTHSPDALIKHFPLVQTFFHFLFEFRAENPYQP